MQRAPVYFEGGLDGKKKKEEKLSFLPCSSSFLNTFVLCCFPGFRTYIGIFVCWQNEECKICVGVTG